MTHHFQRRPQHVLEEFFQSLGLGDASKTSVQRGGRLRGASQRGHGTDASGRWGESRVSQARTGMAEPIEYPKYLMVDV